VRIDGEITSQSVPDKVSGIITLPLPILFLSNLHLFPTLFSLEKMELLYTLFPHPHQPKQAYLTDLSYPLPTSQSNILTPQWYPFSPPHLSQLKGVSFHRSIYAVPTLITDQGLYSTQHKAYLSLFSDIKDYRKGIGSSFLLTEQGALYFSTTPAPRELASLPKEDWELVALPPLKAVEASAWHTLALSTEGVLFGSGQSEHRQLGALRETVPNTTFRVSRWSLQRPFPRIRALSTGACGTLLITEEGVLLTSGESIQGELGYRYFSGYNYEWFPSRTPPLAQVKLGYRHSFLTTETGVLYGAGVDDAGQLGVLEGNGIVREWTRLDTPLPVKQAWSSLSTSFFLSYTEKLYVRGRALLIPLKEWALLSTPLTPKQVVIENGRILLC